MPNIRGRAYTCPECEWKGEKTWALDHFAKKHCTMGTAPFACRTCNFLAGTRAQLNRHLAKDQHKRKLAKNGGKAEIEERVGGDEILENFGILTSKESEKLWNERKGTGIQEKRGRSEERTVTSETVSVTKGRGRTQERKKKRVARVMSSSSSSSSSSERSAFSSSSRSSSTSSSSSSSCSTISKPPTPKSQKPISIPSPDKEPPTPPAFKKRLAVRVSSKNIITMTKSRTSTPTKTSPTTAQKSTNSSTPAKNQTPTKTPPTTARTPMKSPTPTPTKAPSKNPTPIKAPPTTAQTPTKSPTPKPTKAPPKSHTPTKSTATTTAPTPDNRSPHKRKSTVPSPSTTKKLKFSIDNMQQKTFTSVALDELSDPVASFQPDYIDFETENEPTSTTLTTDKPDNNHLIATTVSSITTQLGDTTKHLAGVSEKLDRLLLQNSGCQDERGIFQTLKHEVRSLNQNIGRQLTAITSLDRTVRDMLTFSKSNHTRSDSILQGLTSSMNAFNQTMVSVATALRNLTPASHSAPVEPGSSHHHHPSDRRSPDKGRRFLYTGNYKGLSRNYNHRH